MDSTNRASSRGLASVLSSMPSWARQARQVVSCRSALISAGFAFLRGLLPHATCPAIVPGPGPAHEPGFQPAYGAPRPPALESRASGGTARSWSRHVRGPTATLRHGPGREDQRLVPVEVHVLSRSALASSVRSPASRLSTM